MAEARSATTEARRPRLAYVVHTLNPGGTERLAVDMALAFASQFDVQVVCLDEPGLWAADLRERGIPVHCVWRQPGFDPAIPVRLARLFRAGRTDLIHAHQCTPWFYAALSRLLHARPRLLLEEHGRFHPEVPNQTRALVNRLLIQRLTHAFVAVSADVRNRLVRYEGLAPDAIRIVYNGVRPLPVPSAMERRAVRQELGLNHEDFVVGAVGRLDPIKNLPMLLRGFAACATKFPRLKLAIVGEGPERGVVERLIGHLGLTERVILTGFRSDARQMLAGFDLFAMTSLSEGTSVALLEAMNAGLPVVVTAVGGNPELIKNGRNGVLVPSDDAAALATAIDGTYSDVNHRSELGRATRQDFLARFSFDAMLAQYAQLYGELLKRDIALHEAAASS